MNKYNTKREYLANVYKDTKYKCIQAKIPYEPSSVYTLNDVRYKNLNEKNKFPETNITVVNQDVLEVAQELALLPIENIGKILILNLASASKPGGGVINGAMAQEEELFRRTNYFMSLTEDFYPIHKTDVIHTPNVYIIKDKHYIDLLRPVKVSMLAASALRKPYLTTSGKYNNNDYKIMHDTIENIFKTAYTLGYTTLVLGALGCGVYENPAIEVVDIFNKCQLKYGKYFKRIVYAVLSKDTYNFTIFNKNIITQLH